jgi:hypothetical protein
MNGGKISNFTVSPQAILGAFKAAFAKRGFPYVERSDERFLWIDSYLRFEDQKQLKFILEAAINLKGTSVQISADRSEPIPKERTAEIRRLIGTLNGWAIMGHLFIGPPLNQLSYRAGIFIGDLGFDNKEFERVLEVVLTTGHEFLLLIDRYLKTGEDPDVLLATLFSKMSNS